MIVVKTCLSCFKTHEIDVQTNDYIRWQKGESIQDVMPYLNEDERELLMSGLCGKCFDQLFEGDGEE